MDTGENTDRYVVQATHPQTGETIDERCADIRDAVNRAAELIRAGYTVVITTLDEPKSVAPTFEKFCEDALPWVHRTGDMQRFDKQPV